MCGKVLIGVIVVVVFLNIVHGIFFKPTADASGVDAVKKAPRLNLPWLWIGMWCNGCPPRSCEDDEAVIHGYCCGCAYSLGLLQLIPLCSMCCHSGPVGSQGHAKVVFPSCCEAVAIIDHLPVICPEFLQCPLNLHGLCHDYEYMMRCCC